MKINAKNRQNGYTLIEMIVALVCLAIFAGLSISSYTTFIDKSRVKGAINIIMEMKKAVNDMSEVCNGYPARSSVGDLNEFLALIDTVECDEANSPGTTYVTKYNGSSGYTDCATNVSLGTFMGVEGGGGKNVLCAPACTYGDKTCGRARHAVTGYFVGAPNNDCSPMYGSAPYNGGSPGWNYRLLADASSPRNVPVGVICGVTEGGSYKIDASRQRTPVVITINTGGYYQNKRVQDGTAVYGIDGKQLPNGGCSCGPYCEEVLTGRAGCCGACGAGTNLGYKF